MILRANKPGVGGVSVGGVEYTNDADGCIVVPDQFAASVCTQGYEPVQPPAEPESPTA